MSTDERIEAAAVFHGGVVYTLPPPARHHDVLRFMVAIGVRQDGTTEQGFVTNAGDFVRRKAALIIAENAGQLQRKQAPGTYQGPELFSEDLW